jgi:PEP-CTERM motif
LGPGTPTFSTDSNGNGIVIAPNGQVAYSFPQTPNTVLTPGQGIMANFPQLPTHPGPGDYGDPAYDFNNVTSAIMNSNGLVAATDQAGVSGHLYTGSALAIQHNADGSWGQATTFFTSGSLAQGIDYGNGFTIVGLSKSNEILINIPNSYISIANSLVYNASTNTTTHFTKVLSDVNGYYYANIRALAIDGMGRIVLSANRSPLNNNGPWPPPQTNLLLTPDGVSSDPIELTVPEPSTLALMLLAMAGYAIRRASRRDPID